MSLKNLPSFLPGCLLLQPAYLHFLEKHKEKDRVIKYLTITRDIYHHLLVWSRKTSWPTENKRQDTQSRNCSGFKGKCTPRKIRTFVLNLAEVKNVYIQAKWHIKLEIFPVSGAGSDLEYFYSHLDGMLVHCRQPPPPRIKFNGTNLPRGIVRVILAQHNISG